ncbi:hypothetical protein JI739_09740 [Ramlibacter sp. AW1]|uniref:Cysteine dioxygenase n=1 Tax=Ramlibacter aurantiacus TaxID=2801330 RepID=A0A936ZFM4_9BURK|nr:hypothetical protein [Ramlibacter aurantiacus]MBL0420624.1 hypothetical protein [Ramlibacter aurantiacus]
MPTTLDSLARDCRQALGRDATPTGRQQVVAHLRAALRDPAFVAAQFGPGAPERRVLYEDAELGFCIVAHAYTDAKEGAPHDHGPSWAIYGQAQGETLMTDFAAVEPATPERCGKARPTRSYALRPGDAHLYNEGDLHAPTRQQPTRLIRIEGVNMDRVRRLKWEVAEA